MWLKSTPHKWVQLAPRNLHRVMMTCNCFGARQYMLRFFVRKHHLLSLTFRNLMQTVEKHGASTGSGTLRNIPIYFLLHPANLHTDHKSGWIFPGPRIRNVTTEWWWLSDSRNRPEVLRNQTSAWWMTKPIQDPEQIGQSWWFHPFTIRPNWYTEETPGRCPWLAPVAM